MHCLKKMPICSAFVLHIDRKNIRLTATLMTDAAKSYMRRLLEQGYENPGTMRHPTNEEQKSCGTREALAARMPEGMTLEAFVAEEVQRRLKDRKKEKETQKETGEEKETETKKDTNTGKEKEELILLDSVRLQPDQTTKAEGIL